ncbi:hypothetical protein IscW_ISCW010676 [Ixodes scapularis]|uniref:Synaptophysin n=1 Tax=Ixodes scapularis TaxID=6945 RepID=B7Q927_IXOSC|nr:hypothetical protein IscW_ISCW010676 [Ixodes scapularis]|eukprot:XP_002405541.1 hypothetical protein IscW_ISCW010676 [Ixodes scapularis]
MLLGALTGDSERDGWPTVRLPFNFASNAEFFVATGVLSFLYCVGILGIYLFSNKMYIENQTVPIIILGFFNVLLWVAGCWFVFKETSFHAQRQPPPVGGGGVPPFPQSNAQYPPQSPPPIQSPTFGTQY